MKNTLVIFLTLNFLLVNSLSKEQEATTATALSSENDQENEDLTTDSEIVDYDKPIEKSTNKSVSKKEKLIVLKELESKEEKDDIDDIPVNSNDAFHDVTNDITNKKSVDTNETKQTDSYNEDEDSEIEGTTFPPLLDSLNATLPSLSRMIDLAEEGQLDILNQTQTRRIILDLNSNEDFMGANDINRLSIEHDLDHGENDDTLETDLLQSPGTYINIC